MPSVVWQFTATGQPDVIAAYAGIEAAEKRTAAAAERAEAVRTRATARGSRAAATAEQKAAREHERAVAHVERIRDRYFQNQQRQDERAAQAQIRSAQKVAREQEKAIAHVERVRDRYFRDQQRQEERANAKLSRDRGRLAKEGLQILGGAALGAYGTAGYVIGSAVRNDVKVGELANRYAINARLAGENVDAGEAKRNFQSVAIATPGQSAESVAQAALMLQSKTGRLADRGLLQTMATAASAGGGSVQDISSATAVLGEKFDVKSVEDLQAALAALTEQGAKGAFEMKDMASQLEEMGAAAQRFNIGKGVGAVKMLGGLAQMARSSTGSAEEAKTSVEHMFSELIKHAPQFRTGKYGGKGVSVFDKSGQTRPIEELLPELVANVGGKNMEKKMAGLEKGLGDRGIRAVSPLIETYTTAMAQGKDAVQAMRDKMAEFTNTSATWKTIQEAAAQAQQDSSAKIQAAWSAVEAEVGERLTPQIVELIGKLPEFAAALDPAIGAAGLMADAFIGAAKTFMRMTGRGDEVDRMERMEATKKRAGGELKQLESFYGPLSPEQQQRKADLEQARRTGIEMVPVGAIHAAKGVGPGAPAAANDVGARPVNNANGALDEFAKRLEETAARLNKIQLDDRPSIGRNL